MIEGQSSNWNDQWSGTRWYCHPWGKKGGAGSTRFHFKEYTFTFTASVTFTFSCGEYFYETKTSTFTFKELKNTSSENKFLKFNKFSFFTTSLLWLSPFKGYNLTFPHFWPSIQTWQAYLAKCLLLMLGKKVTGEIFDHTITSCHDWGVKVY